MSVHQDLILFYSSILNIRSFTMSGTQMEKLLKNGLNDSLKSRSKRRRSKFEIMVDILSVAQTAPRKTEIVYKANLNFNRLERYLSYLEEKGLIVNLGSEYKTTEKGKEFLQEFNEVKKHFLI